VSDDEITCGQFVELVTDYFEDALAPDALARIEEHLVMCEWCVTYAAQIRATISALGALQEPCSSSPPQAALDALRARRARRA
jgi:predicted anti-sigma-YlaC factor YlaD